MIRPGWQPLALALIAVSATATFLLARQTTDDFPHEVHAGLFPLCIGCHVGIPAGESGSYYPPAELCSACHNGDVEDRIEWTGPSQGSSVVEFDHQVHAQIELVGEEGRLECGACHTQPGSPRMMVEAPIPTQCFGCHAHPATDHFVDAGCTDCHRPVPESGMFARMGESTLPSTHLDDGFLAVEHRLGAIESIESCSTCHVREQCTGCHVGTEVASPVHQLPSGGGWTGVPTIAADYPTPESHVDPRWLQLHGNEARTASCSTCHTQESCTICHAAPGPVEVQRLLSARASPAPGAMVVRRPPESHQMPLFRQAHGRIASARPQSCASCHERVQFCGECHESGVAQAPRSPSGVAQAPSSPSVVATRPVSALVVTRTQARRSAAMSGVYQFAATVAAPLQSDFGALLVQDTLAMPGADSVRAATPAVRAPRSFHPASYVLRHSADAYGRRLDCASCHSTQIFCRDCHRNTGLGSVGRLGPGYHDAEPVWLLRHGQAARQTLESCASCHAQRDCMQCHSQTGAFRVSPHGPAFDAGRAQRANPEACAVCHLDVPGGQP